LAPVRWEGHPLKVRGPAPGVIFVPRTPPGSHRPRVAGGCVREYSSPSTPYRGGEPTECAVAAPVRNRRYGRREEVRRYSPGMSG